MWRFLPLHSACARQPPTEIVSALIRAYPQGAGCCDDQGIYPLHYAAGNQASTDVIRSLIFAYPPAAGLADPQGMFPIHYMSQWGPSESDVIGIIVFADREACTMKDDNGCTALDYALETEYPYHAEMLSALRELNKPSQAIVQKPQLREYPYHAEKVTALQELNKPSQAIVQKPQLRVITDVGPEQSFEYSSDAIPRDIQDNNKATSSTELPVPFTGRIETVTTPASYNKAVRKLNAEIVKLRAEAAFNIADQEEKYASMLEDYTSEIDQVQASIGEAYENTRNVEHDLRAKGEFCDQVERRISEMEDKIKHTEISSNDIMSELETATQEMTTVIEGAEALRMKANTVANSIAGMAAEQDRLVEHTIAVESEVREESDARKKKLQAMFDDEMKASLDSVETKRVHGTCSVRDALDQQKSLMKNCLEVLDEYDDAFSI
jgi:hypothetical protein